MFAGAACSSGSNGSGTFSNGGSATTGGTATAGGTMNASGGSAVAGSGGATSAAGTGGEATAGSSPIAGTSAGGGAGAACQPNPAPPAATGVCSGAGTRVLTLADAKVEDFEAAVISPGWSSFDQPDNGGAHDVFKMALVTTDGAATTKQSGEYQGTGILTVKEGGFGAGTVYNTAIDTALGIYCVDVSAFDGVA
ncbi:MAG TPA: hypothetical protein VNW92_28845, partial [Polyangiaceae bacterium]|nr:hypothetical protein [Polyangiaceae bacterium]